jgi:hypothetical protein
VTTRYAVESGKLVARDATTGDVRWSQDFGGCPALKVLPLPDGACLVLLDLFSSGPTCENLLKVAANGEIVRRIDLSSTHDGYVDVQQTDEGIVGHTWEGWLVRVNPDNGRVQRMTFSK